MLAVTVAGPPGHLAAVLSAEGGALALGAAVLIDTWAVGGPRFAPLMDRIAFIGWTAAATVAVDGLGLAGLLTGTLSGACDAAAGLVPSPLWAGIAHVLPQVIGLVAFAVILGCLLPARMAGPLGHLGRLDFSDLDVVGRARGGGAPRGGPGAPGGGAPSGGAPSGGSVAVLARRLFPGKINVGMIGAAVLLVVLAPTIRGGAGGGMRWLIWACVSIAQALVGPLLHGMGMT